MALVDRHVGRLADRAAGMVQPFRHVGQLHELLEIRQRRVAPPALVVAHEGGAIDRGQHAVLAADHNVALAVAGDLGVLRRRGRAELSGEPARDAHPLTLDVCAGIAPTLQRLRIVDEIDADLLQHGLGVVFDDLDRLIRQDLEIRDIAGDVARGLDFRRATLGAAGGAASAAGAASTALGLGSTDVFAHFLAFLRWSRCCPPGAQTGASILLTTPSCRRSRRQNRMFSAIAWLVATCR